MELKERYLAAKRRLFELYYSDFLNEKQCEAVFAVNGPLLILAGAGSGKTTVLVRRIAFQIRYGNAYHDTHVPDALTEARVRALEDAASLPRTELAEILDEFITEPCPPWCMLAITFTNKAANEIKERLSKTFEDEDVTSEIWAGTFHSICMRILRRHTETAGLLPGFSIYDTDDKKRLVTKCMKELDIDEKNLPVRTVMNAISSAKDNLVPPDRMDRGRDLRQKHICRIYEKYQEELSAANALDFDDIIMKTVELLSGHPEIAEYYQNKFRYVSVDEYQDTNPAQFALTNLLAAKHRNLMVVGDDDQSIYKFRGATVENILSFDSTYPDAIVIKLEQNYRSTKTILAAANAVIDKNRNRYGKKLWCNAEEGEKIVLCQCRDQNGEARYITDRILELVVKEKYRYRDFAVLYRLNELARALESGFTKSGIPYRVLGGQRFYDRKEIKDIKAYLQLILNDSDTLALFRIINEPKRKIGAATLAAVSSIADEEGVSMMEIMRNSLRYPALSKVADKLIAFTDMIARLRALSLPPSKLMEELYAATGYEMMLHESSEDEIVKQGRLDSLHEFISAAAEYEARVETPTLVGFMEEVSLVSDTDKYDENADAVVLMTIHSAKGLEFPVVFLSGMEDGVFPGLQNIGNTEEMNEERRLAYVAITRAKRRLFLTHTEERMLYGRTGHNPLSCFVREEMPKELLRLDYAARPHFGMGGTRQASAQPRTEHRSEPVSREFSRRATLSPTTPPTPAAFGVKRLSAGTRVRHIRFGTGVILSAKDFGADILYEVRFEGGDVKKLMATYAKLEVL